MPSRPALWKNRIGFVASDELEPGRWMAHVEGKTRVVATPDGTFASVEEAVAWARERADVVHVRLPDEQFYRWAGTRPPSEPRPLWPRSEEEAAAARLAAERSAVQLGPGVLTIELHPASHDDIASQFVAEGVAARLAASGFVDVRVLDREDAADLARAERLVRRAQPREVGYTVSSDIPWTLTLSVSDDHGTPTADEAVQIAAEVLGEITAAPPRIKRATPNPHAWWRDVDGRTWGLVAGH